MSSTGTPLVSCHITFAVSLPDVAVRAWQITRFQVGHADCIEPIAATATRPDGRVGPSAPISTTCHTGDPCHTRLTT